jgi:lipoyl(octanoyl) transferase
MQLNVLDVGIQPYLTVLQIQEDLFNKNLRAKESGESTVNTLILCEHTPVYTLGKSGKRENILVPDAELNAEYYHVQRGGDVTFHGPGQLVVYPIFDLETIGIGLAEYITRLEETIIQTIAEYGLSGERLQNAAGIWLHVESTSPQKICAIGVRASRNITMHGLAVNVNTNLSFFDKIVPCGLEGKGVTSIQKELRKIHEMEKFKEVFIAKFKGVFSL